MENPTNETSSKAKVKKKRRGRKPGRKPDAITTPKKRGRKPGRKAKAGRRGRKPNNPSTRSHVDYAITGGVLIMNSIPTSVKTMVFVKGNKLTTVEI